MLDALPNGSNYVFPAEDNISETGQHELSEGKPAASSGLNHERILLQQSEYLHSMLCVFSEVNVTVAPFLRPKFHSKAKRCQGAVSIQVLFWEAAGMWPRCPPESKDCKCHHEEYYSDKLFVLPTQALGSVCRNVLLKLSENPVPNCLSSTLPLAVASAASWIKPDLRGKDWCLSVGDRDLHQPNPYWGGDQESPFSNSVGKPSIISQDPSFVMTLKKNFVVWRLFLASYVHFLANQSPGVGFALPHQLSRNQNCSTPKTTCKTLVTLCVSYLPLFLPQNLVAVSSRTELGEIKKSIAMFGFVVMLHRK